MMIEHFGNSRFTVSKKSFFKKWENKLGKVKTISNDIVLYWAFSVFFSKAVEQLKIPSIWSNTLYESNDQLKEALLYFENHPNIVNVKWNSFRLSFIFRKHKCSKFTTLKKTYDISKACPKSFVFLLRSIT